MDMKSDKGIEENALSSKVAATLPATVVQEAKTAAEKEHSLSLRDGLRNYRKAITWSLLLSAAVIMEGYDTLVSFDMAPMWGEKEGERSPSFGT